MSANRAQLQDRHSTTRMSIMQLTMYVRRAEQRRWDDAPALREELRLRVAERAAEQKAAREATDA